MAACFGRQASWRTGRLRRSHFAAVFGAAASGSGGVAYVERMRCDRTAEFLAFPVPDDQRTDMAEHRGEPPPDHTGSGMGFLAPGGDNRKLSRADRVIDRHHLGEGAGRAEDL